MKKFHCHRSDRMAQQMYCGRSTYNDLYVVNNWDQVTCRPCRRAIRKKQVEYRAQNPHLAHFLPPVMQL